jgi:hypothetical protein
MASNPYCYYYLGNDGFTVGLDEQGNYNSSDGNGMELQYPVMQGDDGSFIYMMPGFQPVYAPYNAPYNPYVLPPTVGVDSQYVGQQPLSSPIPMFQQSVMSPGYFPATIPVGESVPGTYMWDPSVFVGDGAYANSYNGMMEIPNSKANKSSLEVSSGHGTRKQSKPVSKVQSEFFGKDSPHSKFQFYTQGKVGPLYSAYPANSKTKAHIWNGSEKPKTGKTNNIEVSLSNEQNHGSRTANGKISLMSASDAEASLVKRDNYNLPDFQTKYDHAFFFVIKSYSEDDIHRSIKYNVWSSTPNGNKRLDTAYQEAQCKAAEKGSNCPVFLFFSVNASGQFCGVAEMTGRVDFSKSMDFWQQDKWSGYFPVKWHIIKDVPNQQLRHIILEYNDNKPVTNSRDTQEVRNPQGTEMLNVLKSYGSKTSILDDFDFYESRQKVMQEKRIRSSRLHVDTQQKKDTDELAARLKSELQVTE